MELIAGAGMPPMAVIAAMMALLIFLGILAVAFGDLSQNLASCRVVGWKSLAGRGVDPLAVD